MSHHKGKKVYKKGIGKYRRYRDENRRVENRDKRLMKTIERLAKKHPEKHWKVERDKNDNIIITNRPKIKEE